MKRSAATVISLAAMAVTALGAPKIALVRVTEIYSGLASTAELQKSIKEERATIMRDPRAEDLRRIIGQLRSLQEQLANKDKPLDEATSRKVSRNFEIKRQEAQTLQKEFESFKTEREKEINRRMVTAMRESLDRIVSTSRKLATEQGFDMVIDSSGNTNTGVPFVLYSKNPNDLTDNVKAALQDAAAKPAAVANDPNTAKKP
ncbi:MAG: OmpH family outer membrane protein [Akkermansiaceae bacterium]|nr:OmpH family outer membrane protein [Akkermansiaceae bacterium]